MDVEIDDLMQGFADIEMGPAVKEVLVCMPKQTKTTFKKTIIQQGDQMIVKELKTSCAVY